MNDQLTINHSHNSYGNELLTFDSTEFKNQSRPLSNRTLAKRCTLAVLSILGLGVSSGFAINEQVKPLRSKAIYELCTFFTGVTTALFYHAVCPDRFRKHCDYYLSATSVEAAFGAGLIYRNPRRTHIPQEITQGVLNSLFGFHLTRNILIKLSLDPTDFHYSLEHTEDPHELYPFFFPSTRDVKGTAIMMFWYTTVCFGLGGLYYAEKPTLEDYWNDIGVYNNALGALVGGWCGTVGTILGANGIERFEKYYKTLKDPSYLMQGTKSALRIIHTTFSLFSTTVMGTLFQVSKSLYSTLPTKRQVRQVANSGLSFFIMMVIGAFYMAQNVLKGREAEDPLSMRSIQKLDQKEFCSPHCCHENWKKTCKVVIDLIFPYICLLGMMTVFGVILGLTDSEKIRIGAWGVEATFFVMWLATITLGNQPLEKNPHTSSEGVLGSLKEWKAKCANSLRYLVQDPESTDPLYMYFTTKFPLNNHELKSATFEKLFGIICGLIFFAIGYVKYRMLYRSFDHAPTEVPYLGLMMLSNDFAQGFVGQGNHT